MSEQTGALIVGTVINVGPVESLGANGFRKCVVVIDTGGEYRQQIPIEFIKDMADKAGNTLNAGDEVVMDYNLRGREYNGKYYASVQGWRFKVTQEATRQSVNADSDADDNMQF